MQKCSQKSEDTPFLMFFEFGANIESRLRSNNSAVIIFKLEYRIPGRGFSTGSPSKV